MTTSHGKKCDVAGYVDGLGYLWCASCVKCFGLLKRGRVRAGGTVYQGATHSDERCDHCLTPLAQGDPE